jgi:hypothetical protein
MSRPLLQKFSNYSMLRQISKMMQKIIIMNAEGDFDFIENFEITEIDPNEIHFEFNVDDKTLICSITWQRYLANQVDINHLN